MPDAAPHPPPLPAQVGLGIGLLAVSTASILIRYAQGAGLPSLAIAALRLIFASLFLLPVALWRRRAELRALSRREWALGALSGAVLGAHFGTWITSLAYTSVASSVVLVSSSPLFVALISALALRERLSRASVGGMGVAMAGGAVVGLSDACTLGEGCPPLETFLQGPAILGDLLALAGAAAIAVYYTIGRRLRASMSLVVYIFLSYGSAAVVLALTLLAARVPLTGYAPQGYGWVLLLALLPQLVGHSSLNWALKYLPATYVSLIVLGEPIGSTLLAMLLLHETPSVLKVIGGVMILAGIVLASRRAE
jgi:drug/metabolite transporter (DMT)-like permease